MWIIRYLEKIIEHPEEMKKVIAFFKNLVIALVIVDAVLVYGLEWSHPHSPWEWIPGFYAFYGFLSTYLIIVISKWIGHVFLMKPETYYD